MTTAAAAPSSARPGIGRGCALEDREHGFELAAKVLHGLCGERSARLRLQLARAAVLLDLLARALDRVLLGVQQVLDQHDQLDLAPLIHAVARAVLRRVQEPELTLPVAQDVRLEVRQLADLKPHDLRNWESQFRSEEHTSELHSPCKLVCRLLLGKKKTETMPLT